MASPAPASSQACRMPTYTAPSSASAAAVPGLFNWAAPSGHLGRRGQMLRVEEAAHHFADVQLWAQQRPEGEIVVADSAHLISGVGRRSMPRWSWSPCAAVLDAPPQLGAGVVAQGKSLREQVEGVRAGPGTRQAQARPPEVRGASELAGPHRSRKKKNELVVGPRNIAPIAMVARAPSDARKS